MKKPHTKNHAKCESRNRESSIVLQQQQENRVGAGNNEEGNSSVDEDGDRRFSLAITALVDQLTLENRMSEEEKMV